MSKNKTRFVILGLLSEGELTGYDIKKIIDNRFSFFWSESFGQIYPELKKLESQNLITSNKPKQKSRRERIFYSITSDGLKALQNWMKEPNEKESMRFEILLKMYFAQNTSKEVIKSQVEEFMNIHKQQLIILNMFQKELSDKANFHENHDDILRVVDFGQKVYEAYINWCRETMIYLERRSENETK